MNSERKSLRQYTSALFGLGVALVWTFLGTAALAQEVDAHAEHAEEAHEEPEDHDDHAEEAGDEHAGHDAHDGDEDAEDHDDGHDDGDADHGAEHDDHAASSASERAGHAGHDADDEAGHDDHDDDGHDADGEEHAEDDPDDHAGHGHDEAVDEAADPHAGHGHEDEEAGLKLTSEQLKRFGIVVQAAGSGHLQNEVSLPGEIVFNEDRVVHLVPRVAGIVREVHKSMGDRVKVGELLAVMESRELADAKSEYLGAAARAALAQKTFVREQGLRQKQVSSEQDFLASEQALAEARIERRSAEQKLHALGLSEQDVAALGSEQASAITRYDIRSPIDGVVTEKHIALGEGLEADAEIFTVVDISSVWVNLTVYTKHLGAIHPGDEIALRVEHSGVRANGTVAMVTPFVEAATRSATARLVLDNQDGRWIPGTFVTGYHRLSEEDVPVVVAREAVQTIEGRDVVFVEHEGAFEATPVSLGHADRTHVEITDGLAPGTRYVSGGAFQLKATAITSTLDSHAGHGH